MYTAHYMHFSNALAVLSQTILPNLLEVHTPGSGLIFAVASVGAELASVDTDVARLYVEVTVEENGPSVSGLTLCKC